MAFERRRLRVYVAGPISKGDTLRNIHRGVEWGSQLFKDGLAPYVPHFDAYMTFAAAAESPGTSDDWRALLEWDLEWVASVDAVFRLAGESTGADLECRVAEELGIPIFYELDELLAYQLRPGYHDLLALADSLNLRGVRQYV